MALSIVKSFVPKDFWSVEDFFGGKKIGGLKSVLPEEYKFVNILVQ